MQFCTVKVKLSVFRESYAGFLPLLLPKVKSSPALSVHRAGPFFIMDATPHDTNGTQPDAPHSHPTGAANGYPDANTGALWQGELSEQHRRALEVESAISPDVIAARGYFTCNDTALLRLHGFSKSQALPGALVVPLWNCNGERAGVAIRHQIPRLDRNGKEVKYDLPIDAPLTLDLARATCALLLDKTKPLIFTEGAKKADCAAANGFPAINLNGVWGFQKAGVPLPDWKKLRPYLSGRLVLIAYDSDAARKRGVELAMRRLEALLKSLGATVKVVYFEDAPDGSKIGLDDFFANGGTVEKLWEIARDLEPVEESNRKRKEKEKAEKRAKIEADAAAAGAAVIEIGSRQLKDLTENLSAAIGQYNGAKMCLFHGAGGLSRLTQNKDGRSVITLATVETVQDMASKAAHWIYTSEREGIRDVFPPRELCKIFAVTPDNWQNIPPLNGIVSAPFFDKDGILSARRGYHRSAAIWMDAPENFDLPDTSPTPENVTAARALILEKILGEVAFADEASRAHAVALMLLPLIRRMIPACAPLHVFDAPIQSSGKSYAAELCILPFDEPDAMNDIADEAEWAKSILAKFIEGRTHLFFDNIKGRLNSASLASYVTSPTKSGRILGVTQTATVSTLGAVWVATSNNAKLDADAASRSLLIRLDSGMECPEDRRFSFDPQAYVRANRAEVIAALVTLVNKWMADGRPAFTARKHRFALWSRIVGGILESAQIPGFLENLAASRATLAPDVEAWRAFVLEWFEVHGTAPITAKNLLKVALDCEGMADLIGEKEGQSKRLGEFLGKRRDQVFANFKICKQSQRTKEGVLWFLLPLIERENREKAPENETEEKVTGDSGDTVYNAHTPDQKKLSSEKISELKKKRRPKECLEEVSPLSPVTNGADLELSGADAF